jgi:hypothetical protein
MEPSISEARGLKPGQRVYLTPYLKRHLELDDPEKARRFSAGGYYKVENVSYIPPVRQPSGFYGYYDENVLVTITDGVYKTVVSYKWLEW